MFASGHEGPYTTEALSVRFGRKATKHVRTLFDRFWLFATILRIANYVGPSAPEIPTLNFCSWRHCGSTLASSGRSLLTLSGSRYPERL